MAENNLFHPDTLYQEKKKSIEEQYNTDKARAETIYGEYRKSVDTYETNAQKAQNDALTAQKESLNQAKDEAEKSYAEEVTAANIDYQKEINPYGVNEEVMAERGLRGSGYAESSKVAMYNAYQNRVALARSTYEKIESDYKISMASAVAQNSAELARIAAEAAQKRLEIEIDEMQYNNTLLYQKESSLTDLMNNYLNWLKNYNESGTLFDFSNSDATI